MTKDVMKPILLTSGDPAGIGPDLIVQLVQLSFSTPIVFMIDRDCFLDRLKPLHIKINIPDYDSRLKTHPPFSLWHVPLKNKCLPGHPDSQNAESVLLMLSKAVEACLAKQFAGLVTCPIAKSVINESGFPFSGHTEFLAEKTNTPLTVMLMTNSVWRVALLTTHIPLKDVPKSVTAQKLKNVLLILHKALIEQFGIEKPVINVCGLNPHAGEKGYLGREEIDIIEPVIQELNQLGLDLIGPSPADTVFVDPNKANAILAMYHDQGLAAIKALDFKNTVNVTLGLPFLRTSVDHGTAFELAGTNKADVSSLLAAIKIQRG